MCCDGSSAYHIRIFVSLYNLKPIRRHLKEVSWTILLGLGTSLFRRNDDYILFLYDMYEYDTSGYYHLYSPSRKHVLYRIKLQNFNIFIKYYMIVTQIKDFLWLMVIIVVGKLIFKCLNRFYLRLCMNGFKRVTVSAEQFYTLIMAKNKELITIISRKM